MNTIANAAPVIDRLPFSLFVRCKSVDHYGFNGRDFHPTDDMIGGLFRVLSIEVLKEDGNPYDNNELLDMAVDIRNGAGVITVFHCVVVSEDCQPSAGFRVVTFVEYEVEQVLPEPMEVVGYGKA